MMAGEHYTADVHEILRRLDKLEAHMDKIDGAIFGNGGSSLKDRILRNEQALVRIEQALARLEQSYRSRSAWGWQVVGVVSAGIITAYLIATLGLVS